MANDSLFTRPSRVSPILFLYLAVTSAFAGSFAPPAAARHTHLTHAQAVIRARAVVARMTLDEKISQLHGISTATQYRIVPGIPRLGIPSLQMTNGPAGVGPGGAGPQRPATALPAPISLASTWDPTVAREYGRIEGEETRETGSVLLEGPDVNIARIPQDGRVFESLGEDPYLDAHIAVANIEGIQSTGIMATVKHFVANNQETNRFTINEDVGRRALHEIYMPAFRASVRDAHVAAVMCAYPRVNGAYDCANLPLLKGVLRDDWHFDGFIMSDWGATHSTVRSAMAGLDLEMPTGHFFSSPLKQAVESGKVPISVINEKLVHRYAEMMQFGLWGSQPRRTPIPAFAHGAAARRIADAGMVLLRNHGDLLPLDPKSIRSIAVIGPYAVRPNSGGGGSSHVIPIYTITPYDGLQAAMELQIPFEVHSGCNIDAAVKAARNAQVAVIMVGDQDTEGRDQRIELPQAQNQLIEAVARANPRTIVVLKTGSAVLMPWINDVPAVLEAWYPGEEDGSAVADILTGKVDPSGKLPITFPLSVDQTVASNPRQYPGIGGTAIYSEEIDVGYRAYTVHNARPLFPFGFGLSYTSFAFHDLKIAHASGSRSATVTFTVTNTGKVAGAEVAQLYLSFPHIAEGNEPPIQLKGFRKVMLDPHKSRTIELELDRHSFSYWSVALHAWKLAPGKFQIKVGDSSENTPLTATLTMQ